MKDDKSYKDFCDAFYELKKNNYDISYGRIAKKTGLLEATVTALANRRRANPPDDEVIKVIAEAFNVKPEYFYEWRLKKVLEFTDKNREFLDHVEKEKSKWNKKESPETPTPPKKESSKFEKESKVDQPVK